MDGLHPAGVARSAHCARAFGPSSVEPPGQRGTMGRTGLAHRMNAVNHVVTSLFNVLLTPLEYFGRTTALILVSGIFGILALVAFKFISYQRGIKAAKDKIKAHLIEIRIYQDDLAIVGKAIVKVLLRNLQYMGLNFGPFVPLSIPFVLVLAQLVVRYAFAPLPVHAADADVMPGRGTLIEVELAADRAALVEGLEIDYPRGLKPLSPLVRVASQGRAFQEVIATEAGAHVLELRLADGTRVRKSFVAGEAARLMQPERAQGFFASLLWPAEDALPSGSPFERVAFTYPDNHFGWLPSGSTGVLVLFLLASMAFGVLVMKPLRIQI